MNNWCAACLLAKGCCLCEIYPRLPRGLLSSFGFLPPWSPRRDSTSQLSCLRLPKGPGRGFSVHCEKRTRWRQRARVQWVEERRGRVRPIQSGAYLSPCHSQCCGCCDSSFQSHHFLPAGASGLLEARLRPTGCECKGRCLLLSVGQTMQDAASGLIQGSCNIVLYGTQHPPALAGADL